MTQKKKTKGGSRWNRFRSWLTDSKQAAAKKLSPTAFFQKFFQKKAPQAVELPPSPLATPPPEPPTPQAILPEPPTPQAILPEPPTPQVIFPEPPIPWVILAEPPTPRVFPEPSIVKRTEKRAEKCAKRRREAKNMNRVPRSPPAPPKAIQSAKAPETVEKTMDNPMEKESSVTGLTMTSLTSLMTTSLTKSEESPRRRKRRSRESKESKESPRRRKRRSRESKESEESVDKTEEPEKKGKRRRSKVKKHHRRRRKSSKRKSKNSLRKSWESVKERSARNWEQVKKKFVSRPCNPASMNKAVDQVRRREEKRNLLRSPGNASSPSSIQLKDGDVEFPTFNDTPTLEQEPQEPASPSCAGIKEKELPNENPKIEEKRTKTKSGIVWKVELVENNDNGGNLFDDDGRPFWQQRGKLIRTRNDEDDTDDELPLNANLLLEVNSGKMKLIDMPNVEVTLDPFAPIEKLHERNKLFFKRNLIYSNTARSMINMHDDDSFSESLRRREKKKIVWESLPTTFGFYERTNPRKISERSLSEIGCITP
ncbi:hypothetical protein QR680_014364 [Steinernema hermaphroditum]|uniref:Uncharacterized protein n=1 Tax=Steinernema hermaphroditum TaxID=289476 RepID=A0AA39IAX4_9BILA|nr:hypothetical protein QR680_014364 [Steinernema hermaphroditum]